MRISDWSSDVCSSDLARFGAAFILSYVVLMTAMAPAAAQVQGPPAPPPPRDAETATANAKEMVDPIRRCNPAEDGSITVGGTARSEERRVGKECVSTGR